MQAEVLSTHTGALDDGGRGYTETVGDGERVARLGVLVSASLALLKIALGMMSGSHALLADGLESAGDVVASGLVLVGLMVAARPADYNHPYGHGRAETLSGFVVGAVLILGGLVIAAFAVVGFRHVDNVPANYAIWPLFLSIGAKLWMARAKYVTGKRIGSSALTGDALNDSVDVLSAAVALCAVGLTLADPTHFLRADRYGALGVALIMIGTGIRVARRSGLELMDTMPSNDFVSRIREVASAEGGVDAVEKIFARKTGLRYHVDIHVEVDPQMTVRDSHDLGHRVEDRLTRDIHEIADVLVHIEPSNRNVVRLREQPL